uniref:Uncharacterized protein n=1 Tax=Timema genevievae TaxID=629358 RepID=A0A7R9PJM9_TIMGE|nr:unnamed protein product [Timema genevievae]
MHKVESVQLFCWTCEHETSISKPLSKDTGLSSFPARSSLTSSNNRIEQDSWGAKDWVFDLINFQLGSIPDTPICPPPFGEESCGYPWPGRKFID